MGIGLDEWVMGESVNYGVSVAKIILKDLKLICIWIRVLLSCLYTEATLFSCFAVNFPPVSCHCLSTLLSLPNCDYYFHVKIKTRNQ